MNADLELVVQFLNTLDPDEGTDELADTAAAQRWLTAHGLLATGGRIDRRELDTARELRSALRLLAGAHHEQQPEPQAAARFTAVAAALPLQAAADPNGEIRLHAGGGGATAALARIVAAVAHASALGTWTRLKICPADTCAWAFVDESKNQSRRWCAMGVCGNRQKTRAYRERQREQAT